MILYGTPQLPTIPFHAMTLYHVSGYLPSALLDGHLVSPALWGQLDLPSGSSHSIFVICFLGSHRTTPDLLFINFSFQAHMLLNFLHNSEGKKMFFLFPIILKPAQGEFYLKLFFFLSLLTVLSISRLYLYISLIPFS